MWPAAARTNVIAPVEYSCTRVSGCLAMRTKIPAIPASATQVSAGNAHIRTTSFSGASRSSRRRGRSCEIATKNQTTRMTAPIMFSSHGKTSFGRR